MNNNYLYKISNGYICTTNMLYTPILLDDGNTLCMDWNLDSEYHIGENGRSEQLLDYFFNREIKYLPMFQKYSWCPKLLDIDTIQKKVYIEFKHETVNRIINSDIRNLDTELPDWKPQLYNILTDFKNEGYYKTALYPHCFYINNGVLKTFDYYGCVDMNNPYVLIKDLEGMIGKYSEDRFANATENGMLNVAKFFEYTLKHHLCKYWTDDPFPEFYKRIYE